MGRDVVKNAPSVPNERSQALALRSVRDRSDPPGRSATTPTAGQGPADRPGVLARPCAFLDCQPGDVLVFDPEAPAQEKMHQYQNPRERDAALGLVERWRQVGIAQV